MFTLDEKLKLIDTAQSFDEVRNAGILPEPDADDGYYFVSYSHRDYKSVLIDIIELQSRGVKIWYDRGLETGLSWLEDVCRKIDSFHCKGVIIYASENLLVSEACQKELVQSLESNKSCLVIKIEDVDLPESLLTFPAIGLRSNYEEKTAKISALPKPELYEFELYKGIRKYGIKPFAILVKVNDISIQKAEIPQWAVINGKNYPVRIISFHAFANCTNLTEVIVPDGWMTIMQEAFLNCYSLKKVSLGKPYRLLGIVNMGSAIGAFTDCIGLESIDFSDKSKKRLGFIAFMKAFQGCISLKKVDLPAYYILDGACFSGCSGLEFVRFNGRQHSGDGMFKNNSSLKRVEYDKKSAERYVGQYTYAYCTSLETIILPKRVKSIKKSAFMHCSKLTEISLPLCLEDICDKAFAYSGLKQIHLPKSLYQMCNTAFYNAKELFTVVIDSKKIKVVDSVEEELDVTIDACFPDANVIYLKNNSKCRISDEFGLTTSDFVGYRKYERRIDNEYADR